MPEFVYTFLVKDGTNTLFSQIFHAEIHTVSVGLSFIRKQLNSWMALNNLWRQPCMALLTQLLQSNVSSSAEHWHKILLGAVIVLL